MTSRLRALALPLISGITVIGMLAACGGERVASSVRRTHTTVSANYRTEIEAWQKRRNDGLRKEGSWLTLVGLHWLKPGRSQFGSDPENAVPLPKERAPRHAGTFILENGTIRVEADPEAKITHDDQLVTSMELKDDSDEEGPTILRLGSLSFYPIKRVDRFGIRVKDDLNPTRVEFAGLDYYPIDPQWRFEARFEPYEPPKKIPIMNIVGMESEEISPGALVFTHDGREYRLDPIREEGSDQLFVIFRDETSGTETYGAGRYIYTKLPEAGTVVLDFNKAYNPPCAFTPFATCPLPPRQNRLPIRIEAGEKSFRGAAH